MIGKHSPFQKLQVLPKDGKPITLWDNQDAALLNVVKGIRQAVKSLQKQYESAPFPQEIDAKFVGEVDDFDELIQQIRECCRQKILNQYSRMRLLSGDEIGVDQLYVDVYMLAKPEHKHFNSTESLLKEF